MTGNKVNFVCKDCGHVFAAFLRDMAKHNGKVVCPKCGKVYGPRDAAGGDKKTLRKRSTTSA